MRSFLIKIGKALSVLKKDGIIGGGQRITRAFFSMFRFVGKGDILFITNGVGDSARYRTWHVAEELRLHGFKCSVTVQDNPLLPNYADKFKIFIFHRTLLTAKVAKLIDGIKKQKKEIIFDADDLVFDRKYLLQMDYLKNMNALEKKLYANGLGKEILADPYVKICTTTTAYLADILEAYGKKVFVVPNKLSNEDLEIAERSLKRSDLPARNASHIEAGGSQLQRPEEIGPQAVRIGYFSGTISHNRDFAVITDALLQIMEKYPNVELFLAGPLDIENRLNIYKKRIKQLPYAPRGKHFENIASVGINLAPLEIGNPFCESKSELKFFEAGIFAIPTVASATRTFSEAIDDGQDGFVAANTAEWAEKLEKLVADKNLRRTMGEKAREKVLAKYANKNSNNEEYYNYLKSRL
jgi:glycosyltransferase involved in cell wall biosynthesis